MKQQVIVNHKGLGVWSISAAKPEYKDERGHMRPYEAVRLIPGVNKVDAENWALVKAHPDIIRAIDDEKLIVVSEEIKPNENPLAKLSESRAARLVKETCHLDLLESWQKQEKRDVVRTALREQIKEMKTMPQSDDGEDLE